MGGTRVNVSVGTMSLLGHRTCQCALGLSAIAVPPRLFFKRISDAHDEDYQVALALAETGCDEEYARFPQKYRFQVSEDCHWREVRAVKSIVGQALQKAILRPRKQMDRKEKVLILDASKEYKTGRAQDEYLPEHVTRIHGWYCGCKDVPAAARVVTLDEIAANDHKLDIPRYVAPKVEQDVLMVEEASKRLRHSAEAAFAAKNNSNSHSGTGGHPSPH